MRGSAIVGRSLRNAIFHPLGHFSSRVANVDLQQAISYFRHSSDMHLVSPVHAPQPNSARYTATTHAGRVVTIDDGLRRRLTTTLCKG
jgi:hypothetical protein